MENSISTVEKMEINKSFWNNKNVLITGHTGFKGTWMSLILNELGANISGISLKPNKSQFFFKEISKNIKFRNSIYGDIRNKKFLSKAIQKIKPTFIFHMAAQSLVVESYKNPINTYETNIIGTINLLEIARNTKSIKSIINITSDKCYLNDGIKKNFKEDDSLGGIDPYSSSKACSEIVSTAYYNSFFKKKIGLATVRAGNVIGGGDWSKNRLIPDLVKTIKKSDNFKIRYPNAVRPWQHVLDPLNGYIILMEKLNKNPNKYSSAWNFGPNPTSVVNVKKIIEEFTLKWGTEIKIKLPKVKHYYESSFLSLNISKSKQKLNWRPLLNLTESLDMTIDWYKSWIKKEKMFDISKKQVTYFLSK